ncbi:two-component response regulator [Neobacillus bataviensis LMG 21833]|uniref:Two-component response regulator n=1 Tax=Neobacillus bataviensis LMG 21833 TaxID=1117379 RepID=K6DRN0_9BACI|nr:response regulator [Neobacillus bataviensis]EKN70893.1 two-component response regulator [Neobacillus bataviensis LMG 21833]
MIKILIVEDDPMVAEFNKRFLQEVKGFNLSGIVHTVKDAKDYLHTAEVDLILLDVYMPGATGLELLKFIREQNKKTDVILITAAADKEKIQTALRYGAVDYLIKPFEFDRFYQALMRYKVTYNFFSSIEILKQEELDEQILSTGQKQAEESLYNLPKGLTSSTLQSVIHVIKSKGNSQFSTDEISEATLISRVSIRKYLKFLTTLGVLEETLTYGIGRPVNLYTLKADKLGKVNRFL